MLYVQDMIQFEQSYSPVCIMYTYVRIPGPDLAGGRPGDQLKLGITKK